MRCLLVIATIFYLGCGQGTGIFTDECPYQNFDVDWEGKGAFNYHGFWEEDARHRGDLLLSNGSVVVLAMGGAGVMGDYDTLVGGRVTSPTSIDVSHVAINSNDDGRIVPDEVASDDSGTSRIELINDNATLQYQLRIEEQGSVTHSSSRSGCEENQQQLAPDLVARLLILAKDLITIIEQGSGQSHLNFGLDMRGN